MIENIETRVLQLFELRLQRNPTVSDATREALLEQQRQSDFGDDDTILSNVVTSADGAE